MAYDYTTERNAFMDRLRAWLETPDGSACKRRIDAAAKTEEPDFTLSTNAAWDIAEVTFEHACPDQMMVWK